MILTNAKYMIAIFAAFAMLFAGVAVADTEDVDAVEAPASYSVIYEVNGMLYTMNNGDKTTVTLADLETLKASVAEGKTFTNWKLVAIGDKTKPSEDPAINGTYAAGSTYIIPAEAKTVKFLAQDVYTTYTAVFNDYDGTELSKITGTMEKNKVVKLSDKITNPAKRDGYIFAGWLAEGATETVKTADLPQLKANVTYTAVYTIDYAINFVDGDKTLSSNVSNVKVPEQVDRVGFEFMGWYIGTEQIKDPAAHALTVTEDTTYIAHWEPINVYVTFVAGDFSKTVPVLYGDCVAQLALPDGYNAWDFDFDTPITENITIEAVAAPAPEPSGMDDPLVLTCVILSVFALGAMICLFVWLKKSGKIVVGRGPNAKKGDEGDIKP